MLDTQGAAHFLEHMLFLGSDKYGGEGDLDTFFDRNGGSCTAYTEYQYICLHFEIEEEALLGGLDRLAHLFISPRMCKDAMAREVRP
jgi:nardilysin